MKAIEETVGFAVAQLCKVHRQSVERAFASLGLRAGQEMTLLALWAEDGLASSQLAERMGVEPPTATKMLQRMEAVDLIRRADDPQDARVTRVYLTEKGKALEQPVRAAWNEVEQRAMAGLTLEEQLLLRRLLLHVRHELT